MNKDDDDHEEKLKLKERVVTLENEVAQLMKALEEATRPKLTPVYKKITVNDSDDEDDTPKEANDLDSDVVVKKYIRFMKKRGFDKEPYERTKVRRISHVKEVNWIRETESEALKNKYVLIDNERKGHSITDEVRIEYCETIDQFIDDYVI